MEPPRPTVSVILPTHNRPRWLLQATASALFQHRRPEEIIIVDDGGARALAPRLRHLAERAGAALHLLPGPGRGPGAARNVGLRAAGGDLIAFLDDDDLWLPHKLAWQVPWFGRRPELGLLGAHCLTGPAKRPRAAAPRRLRVLSRRNLLHANRLPTSTVIARRAGLEECGLFDESLPLAQDWDLWLRIAARWLVALLPSPLALYRLHPGQRSADRETMRRCEVQALRRALASAPDPAVLGPARRRLAWAHCRLGRLLLRRGEPARAVPELRSSLSHFAGQPLAWAALAHSLLLARAPQRSPSP